MKRFPVRPLAALLAVFALIHLTGAAPVAAAPTWEIALADSTEPGRPFVIEGRVYSLPDSQPLRDVTVHFWHADAQGVYGQPTSDGFTRSARFARLDASAQRIRPTGGYRIWEQAGLVKTASMALGCVQREHTQSLRSARRPSRTRVVHGRQRFSSATDTAAVNLAQRVGYTQRRCELLLPF